MLFIHLSKSTIFSIYRVIIACQLFLLYSCASHPIVNPHLPETGKVKKGYAISVENVAPFLWYRFGISDKSELGVRVGLPIYGSGIDYSRLLYKKQNKWDMLNLAWSLNPNYNLDATYYKFKTKKTDTCGDHRPRGDCVCLHARVHTFLDYWLLRNKIVK